MRIITSLIIHNGLNVQRQKRLLSPYGLWESKNHAAIFYLNLTDPPQLNTDLHLAKQKALQLRRHLMNRMGGEPRGSAVTTPHRADVEVFARHLDRERGRQRAICMTNSGTLSVGGVLARARQVSDTRSRAGVVISHINIRTCKDASVGWWAVSAVPSQLWMVEE